jgi:hypothetical protein
LYFSPAIFDPVKDIFTTLLLLFPYIPFPLPGFLDSPLLHLPVTLDSLPFLPVNFDPYPFLLVNPGTFLHLSFGLGPCPFLLVNPGTFLHLSFGLGPCLLLLVNPGSFLHLSFGLSPCPLLRVALYTLLTTLILLDSGPVIDALDSPRLFRKTPGLMPVFPAAVRILAVFHSSGLIAVGDSSPVPRSMAPGAGAYNPVVMPDISWPPVHININIVPVPIEIAPAAEGKPEVKSWPV